MRGTKDKMVISLPTSVVERLTTMAEEREMTVERLVAELVELGFVSLTKDADPPALDPWSRGYDVFNTEHSVRKT